MNNSAKSFVPSNNYVLDTFLKSLIACQEFNELPTKNWTAISRNIPGTTPKQCQKRYDELYREELLSMKDLSPAKKIPPSGLKSSSSEARLSRPSSGKLKSIKSEKDLAEMKAPSSSRPMSADQCPMMVIHVCDEGKNLKQDFQCPRDILIKEMRYFSDYLSTDAQRWEEVDISVHCDVTIFDWLMKFVKRGTPEQKDEPKLEATNVISILISSEFLKMDSLVTQCVEFCHTNMSQIVATPCNMNCINDTLVTRIANLFDHNEADDVKDRKDKFKSKIFQKKIERLFEPAGQNPDSPDSASELFKCSSCKKVLTNSCKKSVECSKNRVHINPKGDITFNHTADTSWDVNDFILDLKSELKTWRDVYWFLWGTVNYLACARCAKVFPCVDYGGCCYHPQEAWYNEKDQPLKGKYLCCDQVTYRFNPLQRNKSGHFWTGCLRREHQVDFTKPCELHPHLNNREKVYTDLLSHKDAVCNPNFTINKPVEDNSSEPVDIFMEEEIYLGLRGSTASKFNAALDTDSALSRRRRLLRKSIDTAHPPRLQALVMERESTQEDDLDCSEDDEVGDEEEPRGKRSKSKKITVDPKAILIDGPAFNVTKRRKWDTTRSIRFNQDAQREEDQRRMKEIISYLTKLRFDTTKVKQKEYSGGIYCKLEAQWRQVNMPPPKAPNALQNKNKPKLSQINK